MAAAYTEPFYGDWNEFDPDAPPLRDPAPDERARWARQRDGLE